MQVGDIMNTLVVVCRPSDTLEVAARLMWECDCGTLPVVDGENRVAGIVTDRDICMSAYMKGRPLSGVRVGEAMTLHVYTCGAEDSIPSAERLMRDRQVRRLPVVDGAERPIGIVTLGDVARFATRQSKADSPGRDVTRSLAEISRPRQQERPSASSIPAGSSGTIVLERTL
jgi:CBS domain-containing protein